VDTIGLLKSVRFCIALWLVVWRSLATIVRLKPSSTVDEIAACQRPADKKSRMERNRLCALPNRERAHFDKDPYAPVTSAGAFVGNDLVVGYSSCPNRIQRARSMRALTKSLFTAPQAVPPAGPGAGSRLCRGEHRCPAQI
jgi:hypothetical protein